MPWDPEWESDRAGVYSASGSASVDQGYDDENDDVRDEEETNGHYDNPPERQSGQAEYVGDSQEEDEAGWETGDQMEVDDELSLPHQQTDPTPDRDPNVTPRPKQKVVGLAVPRSAQVQVVLHSSPKKEAYTVIPDELSADELVTSDVLPGLRPQSFYKSSANQPLKPLPLNEIESSAANLTAPADDTPQPKKRGRPKGWRPGHGSYSTTSTPGSKVKKPPARPPGSGKPGRPPGKFKPDGEPRGKPGRKPAPTGRQLYMKLNPRFPIFLCEWEGCPAELHNLETLRKHVLIVHGRPPISPPSPHSSSSSSSSSTSSDKHSDDGVIVCKWSTCLSSPIPRFVDEFRAHMEEAHLIPFAWHCGDGPKNTSANPQPQNPSQLPNYLFDAEGRQVTPSVKDQQIETEDDRKRRVARINALLEKRDENAPDEPEYGQEDMIAITKILNEKRKRQKELREYAEWVTGGDGPVLGEEEREERRTWRGQFNLA
ncbi:hypothetical protein B0T21DRAFT_279030 [Apiosordaria backusii]|uniref:C2H2-type domain-containing protein n=1 Tax=Apiosordaria backusii TaxID=314023 RepID=A0AA40K6U5_9PEZI|nr:hypothetical protein B0T21DRAFT_279030 [Apiosordaria backusii]